MEKEIAILVPIIIAVVEFLKKIIGEWLTGSKTIYASFLVGAIVAWIRFSADSVISFPQAILLGLYAGGIAAGLWSAGKQITNQSL